MGAFGYLKNPSRAIPSPGGEGKGEGGPPTKANHLAFWTQGGRMAANRFMTFFRKTTFSTGKPPALPE